MSNETKQDVFEELLDAYDDAKSSDGNLHPTQELLDYEDRYASALPDDLPVIPKAVGEYIKNLWKYHRDGRADVFLDFQPQAALL